ncbi:MAG: tyrosine-protein phosphatase [Chlamydiota bacterium]
MFKKSLIFQIILSGLCLSLNAHELSSTSHKTQNTGICDSTHDEIARHFQSVKKHIALRWTAFQDTQEFKLFVPEKSDAILKQEFENIHATRELMWTTPLYAPADHLVLKDLIRAPGCVAFDFNNTTPIYNASTMYIGDKPYIACEGPRSKDIPSFFKLMTGAKVTHLVRLTDSYEGDTKKCHPYWEGLYQLSDDISYLEVPSSDGAYLIRGYDMAYWRDNQGVDPRKLLELVLQVREDVKEVDSLLLVHCSAGVGRTGTFLAAIAIVDAIDSGQPFSIEEIVYRLSLQRVHSVGKYGQYITLHRIAEIYSKQK